jgi:hypothetical protein
MVMLTEDEEKLVEAMARAICDAYGFAPDNDIPGHDWVTYLLDARLQYAAHKAMLEAQRSANICLWCGTGKMSYRDGGLYGQSYIACANCGARQ